MGGHDTRLRSEQESQQNQRSTNTTPAPVLGLRTASYCTENEGTPFGANLSVTLDTGLRLRSIKLDFGSGNQGASRNPGDLDANLLVMATELRAFNLELIQALEGAAMAKQDRQGMQDLEAPDFLAIRERYPFRHRQRHSLLSGKLRIMDDLKVRISTKMVQHGGGCLSH